MKVDLIQLFMSRSFYYSHYQKCFTKVANHQILMEWLESDPEDCPDDKDVWGADMVKSSYNFSEGERNFIRGQRRRESWLNGMRGREGLKWLKIRRRSKSSR